MVGEKQKKQQDELKKYIVAIDYSRLNGTKLYGAGIVNEQDISALDRIEFEYLGAQRSKTKKKTVPLFRKKIRGIDKVLDLIAAKRLEKIFETLDSRFQRSRSTVILDPKVLRPFKARYKTTIDKGQMEIMVEDKAKLKRSGQKAALNLLNIVDALIRWANILFSEGKAEKYVRIERGTLRKK